MMAQDIREIMVSMSVGVRVMYWEKWGSGVEPSELNEVCFQRVGQAGQGPQGYKRAVSRQRAWPGICWPGWEWAVIAYSRENGTKRWKWGDRSERDVEKRQVVQGFTGSPNVMGARGICSALPPGEQNGPWGEECGCFAAAGKCKRLLVVPSCSLLRGGICCASCLVSSYTSCGCKSANSGELLCDGEPAFFCYFYVFFSFFLSWGYCI